MTRGWRKVAYWLEDHARSLTATALILVGLGVFVFFYQYGPVLVNDFALNNLDGQARAVVISMETKKTITESLSGGRVKVGGFLLSYRYSIGQNTYTNEEFIDRRAIHPNAFRILQRVEVGDTVLIKYDTENPERVRWSVTLIGK